MSKVGITYISHSGFLVEWEHCYWLFDYHKGTIPPLKKEKPLFVFVSHSHRDHFNPVIFSAFEDQERCTYVFANEMRNTCKKEEKRGRDLTGKEIWYLRAEEDRTFSDGAGNIISVHAMQSTDCGAAYVLTYLDKTVYHAGDLHWWVWPGEPDEENRQMTGSYKKEMEYLKGKHIDVAFTPLDPRQEEWYDWGADYLIQHAQVRYLFPMHFWGEYFIIQTYKNRTEASLQNTDVMDIEREGQSWMFPDESLDGRTI